MGVFEGGWSEEMGAAPLFAQGQRRACACRGPDVAQETPLGLFWDGLLIMHSQVGGTWEHRTAEVSGWQEPHLSLPAPASGGRVRHCGNTPLKRILQSATIS